MKVGINRWDQQGVEASVKEIEQFCDKNIVKPLKSEEITPEIKSAALGCLMFLRKNRNGTIKGR